MTLQAVLYKSPDEPWIRIGGMTLLERNLRLLDRAGVKHALILAPEDDAIPAPGIPRPLAVETTHVRTVVDADEPWTALEPLDLDEPFFLLGANLLVDWRIVEALAADPAAVRWAGEGGSRASIARLTPDALAGSGDPLEQARAIGAGDISHYDAEVRGDVPPYCQRVDDAPEAERGWASLIRGAHKQPGDLIEKFIQPPIEKWIVRAICDWRVTPNQITVASIIIAIGAAALFYQGSIVLGAVLAFVTIVLDGVDGKLARVKLMTSRFGELEHVFDYFYENAWYLCLAAHFSAAHGAIAWKVGVGITVMDTIDNIVCALFKQVMGVTIDEMNVFAERFRLVGGRRGIYLSILLVGLSVGQAFAAFQVVLAWVCCTVLVHLGQFAYHYSARSHAEPT